MTTTNNMAPPMRKELRIITSQDELEEGTPGFHNVGHEKKEEAPSTMQLVILETAPPLVTDSTNNNGDDDDNSKVALLSKRILAFVWNVFQAYDFPILLLTFIGIAKAAPEFGAVHVAPEYTATWIAVALIFFLSGIGLKFEEIADAVKNYRFHVFVQIFNFGFVSAVVFEVSRILSVTGALSNVLSDGLALCGCLPMAINAVTVLTVGCHGDEATSTFNEAFGNMIGVFLSPVLMRGYLGRNDSTMSLPFLFWKLVVRVMAPLIVGQVLRVAFHKVAEFRQTYSDWFVRAQKYLLIFIVYTIFCETFASQTSGATLQDTLVLILVIFLLQIFFLACAGLCGWLLFHKHPKLVVVAFFGGPSKTIAMGIPMIQSVYEDNNDQVGLYTLAILIWHPMLLVVGSLLTPLLAQVVDREVVRLTPHSDSSAASEAKVVSHVETELALVVESTKHELVASEEKEMTLAEYDNEAKRGSTSFAFNKHD